MIGPGNMQAPPTPGRAAIAERRGPALLGPQASDPARRGGFRDALQQIQARQSRDEAGQPSPGLEERSPVAVGSHESETRQAAEQAREQRGPGSDREAEGTAEARRREAADESVGEAAASEDAEMRPGGDEEATEAAKAAGVTQASVLTTPQTATVGEEVQETADGGESASDRFVERVGAQSRQSGGGESMEFGPNPEQLQAQPAQVQQDALLNPFDMLDVHEVMDPDVQVDTMPDQLLDRLTQAMGATSNAAVLDEAADVVLPQVVRGVVALLRDGAAEMRLHLQPADLGEIELRVRAIEGVVRGEITVQSQEVRHLLESQITRLRAALADQGMELQDFAVGVAHDGRFSQPERGGQEAFGDGSNTPWSRGRGDGGESAAVTGPTGAAAPGVEVTGLGDHEVNYVV